LIFLLNANYQDDADGEVFIGGETINGSGKIDILVRHKGRNAFIGERKFWEGPKKFIDAIDQLLGYVVWRDTKAALILFITRKDPIAVIHKADICLCEHGQSRSASKPANPLQRRDYVLASPADTDRLISLALIPVVIPQ
jgi:hypothetical protein